MQASPANGLNDVTAYTKIYAGNLEYSGSNNNLHIDRINNPEGYIYWMYGYMLYSFYIKDHLGNVRETYSARQGSFYPFTGQRMQYYATGLPRSDSEDSGFQPYKYNGKEWIEAHGLDEYDSQARTYYPAAPVTPTPDPLCEKYYGISPYTWCGGNPVKFIDPDGMWITIYDSETQKEYRYNNGKLYTQNEKKEWNIEYTAKTGTFLSGITESLNKISLSGETGEKLIGYFANDKNNVTIMSRVDGEEGCKHWGGFITADPKFREYSIPTFDEGGIGKNPFWISLGHDLGHRQQQIEDPEEYKKEWVKLKDGKRISNSEKYAMHIENRLSIESGSNVIRTHYVFKSMGGKDTEFVRIINGIPTSIYPIGGHYQQYLLRTK